VRAVCGGCHIERSRRVVRKAITIFYFLGIDSRLRGNEDSRASANGLVRLFPSFGGYVRGK
jgi:hypothetical protein